MLRFLVSLATYNERENLPLITKEIFEFAPDVDILVIDDNSPDGTGDWVAEQMKTEPRLKLLRRSGKLGLGTATLAAMHYAVENHYDFLLNMDADLSHPPRYLPAIRAKAEGNNNDHGFDVVIGSRYVQGGGVEGWPFYRQLMSRCINLYAKFFLGLKTKDNSGAFRCYRVELLKKLDVTKIISKGYSFQEEILYRLKKLNATFVEVPIIFVDRRFGSSKINRKETLNALWILFRIGIFGR
ncbi:MAG: polyprenol monophosphomannose synthase [Planctomycetaceae bacterium]|jgi:dolichol-phosphate mannosyltransferase|nr:polyprenol monophosphomannose synthase [Planctomycetaceae bacterium]